MTHEQRSLKDEWPYHIYHIYHMHRSMQILPIGYTTMIRLQKWSFDKKCLGKLQDVRLGNVADLEELDALQAYYERFNSLGCWTSLVFCAKKSGKPFSPSNLKMWKPFSTLVFFVTFSRHQLRPETILLAAIQAGDTRQQSQEFWTWHKISCLWNAYPCGLVLFH